MEKLLDMYLEKNGLTRYQLSKQTHIGSTTLQRASDKDALMINPRVFGAISMVTDKTPGQVFDEIIKMEMENDMTTDEMVLLLNHTFNKAEINTVVHTDSVTIDHDGEDLDVDQVLFEVELPGSDWINFAINPWVESKVTKNDVLASVREAFEDYDNKYEDGYYPTYREEKGQYEDPDFIQSEYTAVTKEQSAWLQSKADKL